MTHTEAPFSVTFKTARGDLLTTRGENIAEFRANVFDVLAVKDELDNNTFQTADEAQAVGELQRQVGASTVGQAPPRQVTRTAADWDKGGEVRIVQTGPPPDENYPGPCQHGPRQYRDSIARGKAWRRWECNLEWRPNDQQHNSKRCKAVNA